MQFIQGFSCGDTPVRDDTSSLHLSTQGVLETNKKKFRFDPKQTEQDLFWFVSVFRTYIETTETNRTVLKQTKTTQKFLKNTKICSLSNCFGWLVFCLFRFNRNIETLCFGIEAKQLKQTVSKQTQTTLNFLEKMPMYALHQTVSVALILCLFLFNRNTETLCFGIEPKQTFCFG